MNDIVLFLWGAFLGAVAIAGLVWVIRLYRSTRLKRPLSWPLSTPGSLTPTTPPPSLSGSRTEIPSGGVFVHTERRDPPDVMQRTAWEKLTPRKRQVALLVAQGHSNTEVAAALTIRKSTVEGYLKDIYHDLGIRSRTELANFVRDIAL